MADRDALLREAQRKLMEQIRQRTSPDYDAWPGLDAYFTPVPQSLDEAVREFASLLGALRGQNDFVQSWRVVRSPQDHDAATGLDVIADPQAFADFLRENRGTQGKGHSFSVLGFGSRINPNDPRTYAAQITYASAMRPAGSDRVTFGARPGEVEARITPAQWLRMIESLVQWRQTRYVAVGPAGYGIHDRVYEHREWPGWMAWFPGLIEPESLPDFAILRAVGDGTLVATQTAPFGSDDAAALDRAAQLEIALAELGVLPTARELR